MHTQVWLPLFAFVFVLTIKTSGMSLHEVEFDNFFLPVCQTSGRVGRKTWDNDFPVFKIYCESCLPQTLPNMGHKEVAFYAFMETWKNVSQPSYTDLPMSMSAT